MTSEPTTDAPEPQPRTVADLLERINRGRVTLERLAAEMPDDAMVAVSGGWDGWSPKDHLAHVAAWERRLLAEMRGDDQEARFGLNDEEHAAATTDSLNAMIAERHRSDAPASVRAEFLKTGDDLRATFSALGEEDLSADVRPDDPMVENLVDLIGWDTFKHYPHHIAALNGDR